MTEFELPEGWNHDSKLCSQLGAAMANADCGYLHAVTQLGFVLAAMLLGCEHEAFRVTLAEVMAEKLLETARTGRIPGAVLEDGRAWPRRWRFCRGSLRGSIRKSSTPERAAHACRHRWRQP